MDVHVGRSGRRGRGRRVDIRRFFNVARYDVARRPVAPLRFLNVGVINRVVAVVGQEIGLLGAGADEFTVLQYFPAR